MDRIPFGNRAQPCPVSTPQHPSYRAGSGHLQRYRLAVWRERGLIPADLPPATIARGFRLAYGRDPARDPIRRACRAYNRAELERALAALGRGRPDWRLESMWGAVLRRLPLPSTRMLLSQQARLLLLANRVALVEVEPQWLPMVRSRIGLIEQALAAELGDPIELQLREVGQ